MVSTNLEDRVSSPPSSQNDHDRFQRFLLTNQQPIMGDHDESHLPPHHRSMNWRSKIAWWYDPRQWVRAILLLRDTPHSIALGTAIGIFIGLTPTFGIQMILVIALAFLTRKLFRFNRFAALVAVYVSNPFTMLPIFWFNYRVGALFIHSQLTWDEFAKVFKYNGMREWWHSFLNAFHLIGSPLIVGSLIVASVFALPTYPLMKRLLENVQKRRQLHAARKLVPNVDADYSTTSSESSKLPLS
ncbi:hypothetical protein KOR42_21470 [Thalassoglobus neptunius]|uniref:DUF2062 domain-containing protein n=1 Tax=Thalassoglobus neptunius TaxID=1938619 RepID=A0A5C5X8S2_9PLAN|nr:DUF2062 domain-containing protein [Thalassoglobus neptunius]TWT58761.1 hypothetical protein KOR42_21470 [Thalassoglobus neptunius]